MVGTAIRVTEIIVQVRLGGYRWISGVPGLVKKGRVPRRQNKNNQRYDELTVCDIRETDRISGK